MAKSFSAYTEELTEERQPDAPADPVDEAVVRANDLNSIVDALQAGVSNRHWELVEGALFRLRTWRDAGVLAAHIATADPEAMKAAQESADSRANEVPKVYEEEPRPYTGGSAAPQFITG